MDKLSNVLKGIMLRLASKKKASAKVRAYVARVRNPRGGCQPYYQGLVVWDALGFSKSPETFILKILDRKTEPW